MPSNIANLAAQYVAPQIAPALQPHLRGIFGAIIRGQLPQTWWLVTETGSCTVFVDQNGVGSVQDGETGSPDGKVTWTDAAFYSAIVQQTRAPGAPEPKVDILTNKGRNAWSQFRKQFGL